VASSREEKIKTLERLRKIEQLETLRSAQERPIEETTAVGSVLSNVADAASQGSIGENLPIIGPAASKAAEYVRAGIDYASNLGDKPFTQSLADTQGKVAQESADFQKNYPVASTTKEVVGGLAGALALPVPGAGMAGAAGAATRIGGSALMSGLDAATRGDGLEAAKKAATVGGVVQGVMEGIPYVGKITSKAGKALAGKIDNLADGIEDFAAIRAVKSAFGNNKKAWDELSDEGRKTLGKIALSEEKIVSGSVGPVVKFGRSPAQIETAARAAGKKTWADAQKIMDSADEGAEALSFFDNRRLQATEISSKIRDYADKISDVSDSNLRVKKTLNEVANRFDEKGVLKLSDAQKLKADFEWKMKPLDAKFQDVLGKDGNKIVNQSIAQAIKENIKKSGVKDADKFEELYERYGAYAKLRSAAKDTNTKLTKNRGPFSLTDYMAGGAAAPVAAILTEDVRDTTMYAFAVAAANNLLRKRGNAALASSAMKLADVIRTKPDQVKKFYGVLEKAAQKGSASLATTHQLLLAQDREYRELMEGEKSKLLP
jgi:hypothetical protein